MKTAVVFFSLEGNTRFVAETLKAIIGAELIELKPVKPYPTGKVSRFLSGKDAIKRATPQLEPYDFDADAYDTIVIGTPVWAGKPTPPINTFLKENDLSGKRTCFYASIRGESILKKRCSRYSAGALMAWARMTAMKSGIFMMRTGILQEVR